MSVDPVVPATPVLSVVVPLFQEASHLPEVIARIRAHAAATGESYEIVLVDDGSRDDTWGVISHESASAADLRALRLTRNFGKEAAVCAGLDAARGDAVVVMDGDLQHPPELLPQMVEVWKRGGVDVVEAVKASRGRESVRHRLAARAFYFILRTLSGHDMRNLSDFKLMDRRVVSAWQRLGERNLFFRGMIAWLGFERAEVHFSVAGRIGGESGWSLIKLVKLAVTAVTAFSSSPLQIVTLLGAAFFLFAGVIGAQTLYRYVTGNAVSGFTTVILLMLAIGGVQMVCLGIVGTYLSRIYEEVKGRPRYLVRDRIG
jgi:polyisoprenyl-phosphate glycosyltransferase